MVAYSFAAQFENDVATLQKLQTVRGHRKRHARPGEPVQLYCAMRTRHCRKIVSPDPICVSVEPIRIDFGSDGLILGITVGDRFLGITKMDEFAVNDGFGPDDGHGGALQKMSEFWAEKHGSAPFEGVLIRWRPA